MAYAKMDVKKEVGEAVRDFIIKNFLFGESKQDPDEDSSFLWVFCLTCL